MPPDDRRSGPSVVSGTAHKLGDEPSLLHSVDPRDGVARHVGGTFVVVVEATGGKYRRRCYLTVKAAENAARRATDRGETATVYLAELRPLWKVRGGERA